MTDHDTPRVYAYLLGVFLMELILPDGTRKAVPKTTWASTYARPLVKYLLSAIGRRAATSDLIDAFWPNDERDDLEEDHEKQREKYLSDAANKLRQVFGKEIIKKGTGGYELAGPSVLQSDIDECKQLITQAEQRGLLSVDAIPLLEKASTHFKRGGMLEGEDGQWCETFRTPQEETMQYCLLKLAAGYEARKRLWHAREQYLWLLKVNPIDEDTLRCLLAMLHRHGLRETLRSTYEQAQRRFQKYEMPLSETTKELFGKLIQEPPLFDLYLTPPVLLSHPGGKTPQQPDTSLVQASLIGYNTSSQSLTLPHLELPEMLMIPRRTFFYNVLNAAGSSLVLSPYTSLPQEGREHLEWVMTRSSYLDKKAIGHLEATTQNYWSLRGNCAAIDLLDGIVGHFQTITRFLKDSRPTPIYNQLGALASDTAQLLGRTFGEMREFDLAWDSYAFALNMAQEIHHYDLWAAGVARLTEHILAWGEPQEALLFLREAHKRGIHDQRLRVWVSSLEARTYAMTGNMEKFLIALEQSKQITLPVSLAGDIYRTNFNPSLVTGYEGTSFMWLHKPERALPLLNEKLATSDPTSIHRHSNHLADAGRVYAQLEDVENACKHLLESLDITAQSKSLVTLQRIYQGRAELERWKNTGDVKELDERIVEVYKSFAKVKERV